MYQGKKIVQPPCLKEGDKVALVSPAYWVPQEALQQAEEIMRSWGLQPVIGPHTNSLNVNAYAGTADERAADFRDEGKFRALSTRFGRSATAQEKRIITYVRESHQDSQ